MKTLVISAISFVIATAAHAEVKRPGTVLASLCSEKIRVLGIVPQKGPSAVCYANVVGQRANFITIDEEVWQVIGRDGKQSRIQRIGRVGERGELEYSHALNFVTAVATSDQDGLTVQESDIVFRATEFHVVYHTE